ncbi:MAG TPA: bifunctional methylenetetrahydrofolate dehydrogenase/methenyltetrahydrofolate cyclohydrolase FolD [Vulgatibacter sp.]|nr:bifunctional methylenetetrahydrofolate dehydrogenase/methenyltetrahydrofolate cyclohydrolase FolD [Vulgatibacter sp.]
MAAKLIDGKAIAAKVRGEVAQRVKAFAGEHRRPPGLAVVRVGSDPASEVYVRGKIKASGEVGIHSEEHHLPDIATTAEVLAVVHRLNEDPAIDGILVQLPLPRQVDELVVLDAIAPEKDVDGFHLVNAGKLLSGRRDGVRACTPFGIIRLLQEAGCDPEGKRAVVIGRSNIVGKPMALLLLEANATVTICHSRTRDLAAEVARAEIVVAAIGRPQYIRGDWIREGAYVIDVGMNRLDTGKLVGDVEFERAAERAAAITPVPGGVGPMTIAMLLSNTVDAADARVRS